MGVNGRLNDCSHCDGTLYGVDGDPEGTAAVSRDLIRFAPVPLCEDCIVNLEAEAAEAEVEKEIVEAQSATTGAAVDPILGLIEVERRAWDNQTEIQERADKLYFAARETDPELARIEDCDLPGEMGELYRQNDRAREKAGTLTGRLKSTTPRTLAGAIALLERSLDDTPLPLVENVIACLKSLGEPAAT